MCKKNQRGKVIKSKFLPDEFQPVSPAFQISICPGILYLQNIYLVIYEWNNRNNFVEDLKKETLHFSLKGFLYLKSCDSFMHGTFKYLHKYFGYRAEVIFFIPLPSPKFILKKETFKKISSKKCYILHPNKPIRGSILFPPHNSFKKNIQGNILQDQLRQNILKNIISCTRINRSGHPSSSLLCQYLAKAIFAFSK